MRALKSLLLGLLGAAAAATSVAQDYEREARWRAEIVPGLVVGEAIDLRASSGRDFLAVYTRARDSKTALVIVHGIGVHPDHGIIGRLRMDLTDRGFTTLAIQMPVLPNEADARDYLATFPDAADRIAVAAAWLKSKGHRDLVLVSHSLGSRMANAYFDGHAAPAFRAWVALGLSGTYSREFTQRRPLQVFDLYGERDLAAVVGSAAERAWVVASIEGSRQLRIASADHFFAGREAELVEAIATYLLR
jgi:alpha/beta superfamily hydrolase